MLWHTHTHIPGRMYSMMMACVIVSCAREKLHIINAQRQMCLVDVWCWKRVNLKELHPSAAVTLNTLSKFANVWWSETSQLGANKTKNNAFLQSHFTSEISNCKSINNKYPTTNGSTGKFTKACNMRMLLHRPTMYCISSTELANIFNGINWLDEYRLAIEAHHRWIRFYASFALMQRGVRIFCPKFE